MEMLVHIILIIGAIASGVAVYYILLLSCVPYYYRRKKLKNEHRNDRQKIGGYAIRPK